MADRECRRVRRIYASVTDEWSSAHAIWERAFGNRNSTIRGIFSLADLRRQGLVESTTNYEGTMLYRRRQNG